MRRAADSQPRTCRLAVRLSPGEREAVVERGRLVGMSPSTYLREVGLAYEPESLLDQEAVHELALLRGELGRLGGLLKMWLSNSERAQAGVALRIPETLDSIRRGEGALLAAIARLAPP